MRSFLHIVFNNVPEQELRITYATLCTLARIALAPFIIYAMIENKWNTAFILFLCAAFTDMLDGFIARYFNQKTLLGACLDPLADKILLVSCFFTLAFIKTPFFIIPWWLIALFVIKEMVQVIGALWLYVYKKSEIIEPTIMGKITTVVQVGFITWLFMSYFFNYQSNMIYGIFLTLLFVCMSIAFVQYLCKGIVLAMKYRGVRT